MSFLNLMFLYVLSRMSDVADDPVSILLLCCELYCCKLTSLRTPRIDEFVTKPVGSLTTGYKE